MRRRRNTTNIGTWRPHVSADIHSILKHGAITACEYVPWGSNYTFCVDLQLEGRACRGIYKPRRGERPLWDFPDGTLYRREYAAFVTSQALRWPFVPPTVIRQGPHGIGSMQLFVDSEPPGSMRDLLSIDEDLSLARIAAFDIVANNADRKAGHVLRDADGELWAIDHGLCFNVPPKVRTVLLHFCESPVPEPILTDLASFRADPFRVDGWSATLTGVLTHEEMDIFLRRTEWVIKHRIYPSLDRYSSVPWPPF